MRKVKSILSIALTVMLVLGSICVPFTASAETSFNDVEKDYAYYDAIYDLVSSGIIDGYLNEDGSKSFKPEATITRAEFAKLLSVTVNKGVVSEVTTTKFEDVNSDPTVSWAIPYIDAANKAGIINGYEDGTFRPKNPVSYAEAVKMVVCAIGYGPAVKMTDVWYEGYINIANQIGITKSAAAVAESQAPRGLVAQLVYNMTVTPPLVQIGTDKEGNPVYEQDETAKLSGTTVTGILKAVGPKLTNNLLGTLIPGVSAGQILLETATGDKVFNFGSYTEESLLQMLGYNVEVSYDGVSLTPDIKLIRNLVSPGNVYMLNEKNARTGEIDREVVSVAAGGLSLTYQDGNRDKTLGLSSTMYLIYNGKGVGNMSPTAKGALVANIASQTPGSMMGEGTFIDSNGDGSVDVAFVNAYDTYFVSHVDKRAMTITDSNVNQTISLSAPDLFIKKVNSDRVTFEENLTIDAIAQDNVISVARTNDGSMVQVIVSDLLAEDSSNVEVEELDTTYNTAKIGRNNYKSSRYYLNNPNQNFTLGSRGIFYLDFNGDIAAVKISNESAGSYGYLINYFNGSGVNTNNQYVQIWNESTGIKTYEVSSNVRVNGAAGSLATLLPAAASNINTNKTATYMDGSYPNAQIIKYTTGSGGKITSIAIVGTNGLTLNGRFEGTKSWMVSNSFTLTGGTIVVGNNTEVYFIPENDRDNDKGYMYSKGPRSFQTDQSYAVEAYDVKDGVAGAIVVYGKPKLINNSTGVVIVKRVNPGQNSKGEQSTKVTYYTIGDSNEKSAALSDPYVNIASSGIDTGDIIRLALNGNGDIEELEKVYDASAGTFFPAATTSNGAQTPYPATTFNLQIDPLGGTDSLSLYKGTAKSKVDSIITIASGYVAVDGTNIKLPAGTTETNYTVNYATIPVFVYDSAETDVTRMLQYSSATEIAYHDSYLDDSGNGDATNASRIVAIKAKGAYELSAIVVYR